MFQKIGKQNYIVFTIKIMSTNTLELFNTNELELGVKQSIN